MSPTVINCTANTVLKELLKVLETLNYEET